MRKLILILSIVMVLGLVTLGNATLWDRGGGLIYDDVLIITWLQDANYARTSGYDDDGRMNWNQAMNWAGNLSYGGYDDWRLPNTLPVNGTTYDYSPSYNGSTDVGWNISAPGSAYPNSKASEMAYMYYNNLSNNASFDVNGGYPQPGWSPNPNAAFTDGNNNIVSFRNLQPYVYWSAAVSTYGQNPAALGLLFIDGYSNNGTNMASDNIYAWAVRDGDSTFVSPPVTTPEPTTMLLLGLGLIGLAGVRRKFQK